MEQAAQGPTPEQRESAVSAVQAMANASKVALTKTSESESDAERADRSGEDTRTTVEAQPDESAAVDGQRNGAVPVRPEEEAASTLSSVAKTSTSAEESAEDRPESTADGQREQRRRRRGGGGRVRARCAYGEASPSSGGATGGAARARPGRRLTSEWARRTGV